MSMQIDTFTILAVSENQRFRLSNRLLFKRGFDIIAEMADIKHSTDKRAVANYLMCCYCQYAIPADLDDGIMDDSEAIDGVKINRHNQRYYPLYCGYNNGFTKMEWLCNRICFDDPTY